VKVGPLRSFDDRVDEALDALRGNPSIDRVMYAASELGDFSLIWHFLGALQGLRSDRAAKRAVRLAVTLGVESIVVNWGVKSAFRRARPTHEGSHPHHLRQPLTSSFPSGHASAAACAVVLLADDDVLAPVWAMAAAVVATSRVYVRMHHASDIVAGAAIGAVIGIAARRLWPIDR
jgi:undecaprenyl-diphosphatase